MPRSRRVALQEKVMPTSIVLYYNGNCVLDCHQPAPLQYVCASLSPNNIRRGTTNVQILEKIGQHQKQLHQAKDFGNDFLFCPSVPSDAPFVDSWWPRRFSKSLQTINRQIEAGSQNGTVRCCLAIEQKHNQELVACVIRYQDGALRMLHGDDAYRRRGLGAALLSEATKALKQSGLPCFIFILDGNNESEALFTKQGWVREDPTAKNGTGRRRTKDKWIKL